MGTISWEYSSGLPSLPALPGRVLTQPRWGTGASPWELLGRRNGVGSGGHCSEDQAPCGGAWRRDDVGPPMKDLCVVCLFYSRKVQVGGGTAERRVFRCTAESPILETNLH